MNGTTTGNSTKSLPRETNASTTSRPLAMYLVLTNISKSRNIRSLLLTALAFGCSGVFVVGQPQFDFSMDGTDLPKQLRQAGESAMGSASAMLIHRFDKWHECVSHLRKHNIRLVGIEIHKDAQNIEDFVANADPTRDVAFLPGNEGQGLHAKQMESCDAFCVISQYGGGTASLNVNVATSIILHRFHEYRQNITEE